MAPRAELTAVHHAAGFQSRVSVYLPSMPPLCDRYKVIKGSMHSAAAGERALRSPVLGQGHRGRAMGTPVTGLGHGGEHREKEAQ